MPAQLFRYSNRPGRAAATRESDSRWLSCRVAENSVSASVAGSDIPVLEQPPPRGPLQGGILVLPAIPYGLNLHHIDFLGTIRGESEVFIAF